MTVSRDLDRQLGVWFADRATSTPPDGLLHRSLVRVDATAQRPGWSFKSGRRLSGPKAARGRAVALIGLAAAIIVALAALRPAILPIAASPSGPAGPSMTAGPTAVPTEPAQTTRPSRSTPATDTMWTPAAPMLEIRFGETATLLPDGDVLVVGGRSDWAGHGFTRATAELFDPATGRWTQTGSLGSARQGQIAILLASGKVLVAGGDASGGSPASSLVSAELYDPRTGTWAYTGHLMSAREGATATRLPDGRVLVTGGFSSLAGGPIASAEIYDPATGAWTVTRAMTVGRQGHTATLLSNGTVLVAGGGCCDQAARASAEVYDPVTGAWTATGALHSARLYHSAITLSDQKVLVYGGDNRSDHGPVTTAELYDPATRIWVTTGSPSSPGNLFESQGAVIGQAVRLRDETIFAAAGSSERYDPMSGSWTAAGGLKGDLYTYVHTATMLADGRVLVTYEPAAALFDPSGTP